MKNQPIAPMDALNRLSGFHQYCLDKEPVLSINEFLCILSINQIVEKGVVPTLIFRFFSMLNFIFQRAKWILI